MDTAGILWLLFWCAAFVVVLFVRRQQLRKDLVSARKKPYDYQDSNSQSSDKIKVIPKCDDSPSSIGVASHSPGERTGGNRHNDIGDYDNDNRLQHPHAR